MMFTFSMEIDNRTKDFELNSTAERSNEQRHFELDSQREESSRGGARRVSDECRRFQDGCMMP